MKLKLIAGLVAVCAFTVQANNIPDWVKIRDLSLVSAPYAKKCEAVVNISSEAVYESLDCEVFVQNMIEIGNISNSSLENNLFDNASQEDKLLMLRHGLSFSRLISKIELIAPKMTK